MPPEALNLKNRFQLEYPLDAESEGALKSPVRQITRDLRRVQNFTFPSGTTTFDVAGEVMVLTASAAITIATITQGYSGQTLTLVFTDTNISITDDATAARDTINLNSAFTSSANGVLELVSDGTSWREVSRSNISSGVAINQNLNPPTVPPFQPRVGADDDTYVWIKDGTQANPLDIYRYKISNGGFTLDSNGNLTTGTFLSNNAYVGGDGDMATLGAFIYTYTQKVAGAVNMLIRITKSDGTITEMTFSGTAPLSDSGNSVASDGTFLYISNNTTTARRKYSISGTVATFESTLTAATNNVVFMGCDGTFLYTGENSGTDRFLRKYNLTGAVQKSQWVNTTIVNEQIYRGWFTQNGKFQTLTLFWTDPATTSRKIYNIIPFIF